MACSQPGKKPSGSIDQIYYFIYYLLISETVSRLKISFWFRNWEIMSKVLQSYPKCKSEDGQMEMFYRGIGKRRASHQSSEHDLEEQIGEWANMTWFLLALGGVCLLKRRQQAAAAAQAQQQQQQYHFYHSYLQQQHPQQLNTSGHRYVTEQYHLPHKSSYNFYYPGVTAINQTGQLNTSLYSGTAGNTSLMTARGNSLYPNTSAINNTHEGTQEIQYCPVTQ